MTLSKLPTLDVIRHTNQRLTRTKMFDKRSKKNATMKKFTTLFLECNITKLTKCLLII